MQEQFCAPVDIDGNDPRTLEQAISDLRFYFNLARHRNSKFSIELWSDVGAVLPSPEIALRKDDEHELCPTLYVMRQVPRTG
jgi:hypothetical protein